MKPLTPNERKQKERDNNRAIGLVRKEIWCNPKHWQEIENFAAEIRTRGTLNDNRIEEVTEENGSFFVHLKAGWKLNRPKNIEPLHCIVTNSPIELEEKLKQIIPCECERCHFL